MTRQAAGPHTDAYNGRERAFTFRISDKAAHRQSLPVVSDTHLQCISGHLCLNAFTCSLRLESHFIMLQLCQNFSTSSFPLGIPLHGFSVLKLKRIRQGLHYRKLFQCGHSRHLIFVRRVLSVEYQRYLLCAAGCKHKGEDDNRN